MTTNIDYLERVLQGELRMHTANLHSGVYDDATTAASVPRSMSASTMPISDPLPVWIWFLVPFLPL